MFRKKLNKLPTNDLEMQIIDWAAYDIMNDLDDDSDEDSYGTYKKKRMERKYMIRIYGINEEGQSMCVHTNNFTPYFFIKVPQKWTNSDINYMMMEVNKKVKFYAKEALLNYEIVGRKEFYGFTNNKQFKFVRFVFKNFSAFNQYKEVFDKAIKIDKKVYKFHLYESNISPLLRFMHCQDIIPAAWIKIKKGKYNYSSITRCQIEIETDWKNVIFLDKSTIGSIIIASFDLECTSGDGSFPMAKRKSDQIIQIGTTVHKNGQKDCFLHHIITLKRPDEIKKEEIDAENLVVEYYDDEKSVILAWSKFIERLDPDIITGYNIWGFDMEYLYIRVKEGNGGEIFDYSEVFLDRLSRNRERPAKYVEKILASSALGDNILKYIEIEGIVGIDMMKVIQRDHKSESYKLSHVVKVFLVPERVKIFEKEYYNLIKNFNNDNNRHNNLNKIKEFVEELKEFDNLSKDFLEDFNKNCYKLDLIEDISELEKSISKCRDLYKIDLPPAKIFENYADGRPQKIKEIAVYCLKDCELVNRLLMKLNILPNNIGMANVCCVPLSYIFLRGQGIKIFSLVAKECRKEGFLIKVVKADPNDKSSYEGAIVFTPKPGIYFEPIAVNDYASLYPSSMIAENLSHDSLVWVKIFDNKDNIIKLMNGYGDIIEKYKDGKIIKKKGELEYIGLEDYNYNEIKYDTLEKYDESRHKKIDKKYIIPCKPDNKIKIGYTICCFVENKNGNKNLLPRILQKLLKARKDTRNKIIYKTIKLQDQREYSGIYNKDKMKIICEKEGEINLEGCQIISCEDTYNEFMKNIWDGLQGAFKISSNSLYGNLGAKTASISNKYIASCTTSIGRKMVILARDKSLEKFPGAKLVYGDSITGDSPLLLKCQDGSIEIKTIETLCDEWDSYEEFKPWDTNRKEKQQGKCDYQVWSNNKWSDIKRVIRHKCNKKIYRINTHIGCIDVSEDHSLLDINIKPIKPTDCEINKELFHSYPKFEIINSIKILDIFNKLSIIEDELTDKETFINGFFYANGSCDYKYSNENCNENCNEYCWIIKNKDKRLLEKCLEYLRNIEIKTDFKILNNNGVNKLIPKGSSKYMIDKYRNIFYDKDNCKIIPKYILNGDENIRKQFFIGYYISNENKYINEKKNYIEFENKSKIGSAQLFYLMKSLGYNCTINTITNKINTYIIRIGRLNNNLNCIKKINKLDIEYNFIYDIQTFEGIFQAGIGEIIVKNTDSVFINYMPFIYRTHSEENLTEYRKMELTAKYSQEAADYITKISKKPQLLQFEKILYPFIIFSKKRYVSNKYEGSLTKFTQNSMGIVLKRRDNALIVKDIYGDIINKILNERNIEKAKEFFKDSVNNLLAGNVNIKKLIITKSLRGNYANPTSIAHKVLADRISERDPGNKPLSNDRIPYCYIDSSNLKCYKCNATKLNVERCKCITCLKLFCSKHLFNHRQECKKICRFCKKYTPIVELKQCKICRGWYCPDDMYKHNLRTDKYKNEHHDKCKKPLTNKILQGDILEHPEYIKENELNIDYKYYLDHQIEKPCMQIFSLTMKDPYSLIASAVRKFNNQKKGNQEITKWFQILDTNISKEEEDITKIYDNFDDVFEEIPDADGFDCIDQQYGNIKII